MAELSNAQYDKIKLVHDLSCVSWFIEKHAQENAFKGGDTACHEYLKQLKQDIDKHLAQLKGMMCT